jgi:hypothetical protein
MNFIGLRLTNLTLGLKEGEGVTSTFKQFRRFTEKEKWNAMKTAAKNSPRGNHRLRPFEINIFSSPMISLSPSLPLSLSLSLSLSPSLSLSLSLFSAQYTKDYFHLSGRSSNDKTNFRRGISFFILHLILKPYRRSAFPNPLGT